MRHDATVHKDVNPTLRRELVYGGLHLRLRGAETQLSLVTDRGAETQLSLVTDTDKDSRSMDLFENSIWQAMCRGIFQAIE